MYLFQSYSTASDFLETMRTRLESDEVRNALMLGLALRLDKNPNAYGNTPCFGTVKHRGEVVLASLMTPPHALILYGEAEEPSQGLETLVDAIVELEWPVHSVFATVARAERFASLWNQRFAVHTRVKMEQRAFALREVIHPVYSSGHLRSAVASDTPLAVEWLCAFSESIGESRTREEAETLATRLITDELLYLWEDGEVVSMVGLTRPTERGITLAPVYTPLEYRGRGYATSAVACLSQQLLDGGKEFCTLFTDIHNPTSNRIYQNVGYKAVEDFCVLEFVV